MKRLITLALAPLPLLALVVTLLYFTQCEGGKPSVSIEYDTVTVYRVDTVEVPKPYPVEVTRYIDRPTLVSSDTVEGQTLNTYADTSFVEDNYYFFYNAKVIGTLEGMSISFYDNRPEKVITKTVTSTVTEKHFMQPRGLYLGADLNTLGHISPGVMYLKDRWAFQLRYTPQIKAVGVGVHWRVSR